MMLKLMYVILDFNSLYSYCMGKGQFVLYPIMWTNDKANDTFTQSSYKPKALSQPEMEMVLYMANTLPWKGQLIRSALHYGGQLRPTSDRYYTVDFCAVNSKVIYEHNGYSYISLQVHIIYVFSFFRCLFHMHNDPMCPQYNYWKEGCCDVESKLAEQKQRIDDIEALGWTVHTVWGCHWAKYRKGEDVENGPFPGKAKEIQSFLEKYVLLPNADRPVMSKANLIRDILNGTMEGVCNVEMSPSSETVRAQNLEFPPVYKKADVSKDMLGDWMFEFCNKHGLLKNPREQLISVTESRGQATCMDARTVQWLVNENGYRIDELHYFAQYKSVPVFKEIIDILVQLRRHGDTKESLAAIANMVKNILNAGIK